MSSKQLSAMHACLIGAFVIFAYFEVRHHYFVWDTIPFVLENPWIHEWRVEHVIAMFTEAHRANWHPMVLLSHAIDFSLFGDDAGLHHLMNLAYHVLNAVLVYFLVRLLMEKTQTIETSQWTAFLTALIFGLHPQHVESVAWVVERKDVLYAAFAFTSMILYLREIRGWPFVFFCLAIAAKPMAVSLPAILLLFDIHLGRCTSPRAAVRLVVEKTHYIVIAAIVALVTLTTQSIAMTTALDLPLWARLLNAIDNTWFYVQFYLWPFGLSPYYPYPADAAVLKDIGFWLPGTLFLVFTSALAGWQIWLGRWWPALLLAFYLVTLLPVSGIIHVGPAKATDHYVYVSTVPLSFLTGLILVRAWQHDGIARLLSGALGSIYLVLILLLTQLQVSYWNNPLTLWSRVVSLYPESAFGHRNLAAAYVQINDMQQALTHAEKSLTLGSPDVDYVIRLRAEIARQIDEPEAP